MRPILTSPRFGLSLVVALGLLALSACLGPRENRPPVAALRAVPDAGYAPLSVTFDARTSYDPDGDPLTYDWTFDGADTASGAVVVKELPIGLHSAELRVSDGRGGVDVATAPVAVEAVPEGYVAMTFEWDNGEPQACTFLIPWSLFQMYKGRIRVAAAETYAYGDYVADPLDDPTLEDYADLFWDRADGVESFVDYALAFVQDAVHYRRDPLRQEWPWYPLETLVAREGDCEDSAILFVSLLRARGVAASLAHVDTDSDHMPDHVLALVPVTEAWASRLACRDSLLILDGVRFAVAETATDGTLLPLGCDPWGLAPGDVFARWSF